MKQLIISFFFVAFIGHCVVAQELIFSEVPSVNEVSISNFAVNSEYMLVATETTPRRVFINRFGTEWQELPEFIDGFSSVSFLDDNKFVLGSYLYDDGSIREMMTGFKASTHVQNDTVVYYIDNKYYYSDNLGLNFDVALQDTIVFIGGDLLYADGRYYHIKQRSGISQVFVYSDKFDFITSIEIPRSAYSDRVKSLHLIGDELFVSSESFVCIINILDFSKETYPAENLRNGIILNGIIYYSDADANSFFSLPIDNLINHIPALKLFEVTSPRNVIEYNGLVYLIHREGILTYDPVSQELIPIDLNLTFTSYIDLDVFDNQLIAATTANNLYETTIGEEWSRQIIDDKEKVFSVKKTLKGDNLVIANGNPILNISEGPVYLNQDSIHSGRGNIFNLGVDSFLFAQPRCTDISGPPRQISSDQGSTWQDIDFTRCFPFYAQTSIADGRLYFYDNTFTDRPSSNSSTWRDYWATWLDTDNFSSGHIEPHIDIPYRNASVLITEEGILHINPLDSMDQGQSSYVSFDFGQTYTELAAAPNGDLYAAPDGATIVVNNDMGVPRIYYRQILDDPYIEFTITPSGLYPIDRFIFLEDGRGLIPTNSGQILLTNGFTSSTNNHSTLKEVKIYPNPSQGQVNFDQIDNYTDYQFSVYTSTGERLFACDGCNRLEGTLENGIYFIVGINQNERVMSKLIVSKN